MVVAGVFNDYDAFFDTIDIQQLLCEAVFSEFTPLELCLSLQQHLAPRTIQASGFSSESMQVFNSILAGCRNSVAMTRVLSMRDMKRVNEENSAASPSVHVDDTSFLTIHEKYSTVYNTLMDAMVSFTKMVKKLKVVPQGGS